MHTKTKEREREREKETYVKVTSDVDVVADAELATVVPSRGSADLQDVDSVTDDVINDGIGW